MLLLTEIALPGMLKGALKSTMVESNGERKQTEFSPGVLSSM